MTTSPLDRAPSRSAAPALDISGLRVSYRTLTALDDVNLAIGWNRVCGLIGTNGSGKSTLFKSIMGLVKPQAGTIRVAGQPAAKARRQSLIAYVPQSEEVDWTFPLSVRDVVMMGRYGSQNWLRSPRRTDHAAVAEALEMVGMAAFADRQIGQLSGGQRKRVFVARGIAQNASVLLLDEPFTGVDKTSEAMIIDLLRGLAGAGRAILVSTHDLSSLPALCDEAALINQRIMLHGTPREVLRPENLALAFGANPLAPRASVPATLAG
ncbi:metal ABC transporter ATP-binding protein [Lolliginicoccus levis]|uniref:metal ABC transporter ATP-binding protein n=1 Tax=Lolliginicoccus levis TaxID=2919542 RepID=UPI00241E9527|nr:metal ABC transporter ATP-binding protein [Lolliginicoccus levis]